MVISTKEILDVYDLDFILEELDLEYCLPEYFYLSYEWSRYKRKRRKLLEEIQVNLSRDEVELDQP